MGYIHTVAAIRNPAEPDRVWEGNFLVDTGAIDCLVPALIWSRSGCCRRVKGRMAWLTGAPELWMLRSPGSR